MGIKILERATSAVRQIFSHHHGAPPPPAARVAEGRSAPPQARPVRREPDIPLDQIAQNYAPHQTSVKASFRASGEDHQRDQEFANGVADDRWNEEDRFTNKSGDPRIGTHRRSYGPERNE